MAADPGRAILTDLDILALDIDNRLRLARSILESKSGRGQSGEPDRLLWLSGLQRFVNADRAVLVRQTITQRGRLVATQLGVQIIDVATIASRETAHAWLPARFAHVDGPGCASIEARADTQLKGLAQVPGNLVGFLRYEALLSSSYRCLNALQALRTASDVGGTLPQPTATVLAGHALLTLIVAALQDAGSLDTVRIEDMRERVERAVTLGEPDSDRILSLLGRADDVVRTFVERLHAAYVGSGAQRQEITGPSLRDLVADPPSWLDRYIDLVQKLRANPAVARQLPQTAELACFDALAGDSNYRADAFNHLFTPEHRYLLAVAIKCLHDIAGRQIGANVDPALDLDFSRSAPLIPDRTQPTDGSHDASPPPRTARQVSEIPEPPAG
ncbi:hypothetical protein ABZU25_28835 [Micromonospora sp. NPDC005215]|uniref:hypothetical protein n=1 Tax=Micromonospora sp. NPDC005215 TaxID=3157024 RepID=UPI0033B6B6AB